MTGEHWDDAKPKGAAKTRRDRLGKALRANLGRRKAQERARRETATTKGNDRDKPGADGD
jgi:hypothetical protein